MNPVWSLLGRVFLTLLVGKSGRFCLGTSLDRFDPVLPWVVVYLSVVSAGCVFPVEQTGSSRGPQDFQVNSSRVDLDQAGLRDRDFLRD